MLMIMQFCKQIHLGAWNRCVVDDLTSFVHPAGARTTGGESWGEKSFRLIQKHRRIGLSVTEDCKLRKGSACGKFARRRKRHQAVALTSKPKVGAGGSAARLELPQQATQVPWKVFSFFL